MSTSATNFEELAKKYGGKSASPDYDALAKRYGGTTAGDNPPATISQGPTKMQAALQSVENFGKGVGKSGLSLLDSADDWMRQHAPAFMTNTDMGFGPPANLAQEHEAEKPHGMAQSAGKGLGDAAQFLVPGGVEEKGASMLADALPIADKFADPGARILMSGLGAGTVNKAQGGDFSTGALMGIGGGIPGEGLRMAAPAVKAAGDFLTTSAPQGRLALTRLIKPGNALQTFGDALKPIQSERPDFISDFDTTFPAVASGNASSVADVSGIANRMGKRQLRSFAQLRDPFRDAEVDMSPIPPAMMRSVNKFDQIERPGIIPQTARVASRYVPDTEDKIVTTSKTSPIMDEFGRPIVTEESKVIPGDKPTTMRDVDALRRQTNQRLQGFYQKSKGDKYAARANPTVRRLEAGGNALRDIEYGTLSKLSGVPKDEIREGQRNYGAFKNLGDIANRQLNRIQTTTDPTNIAGVDVFRPRHSLTRFALKHMVGDIDSPDAMVRSAVDRFKNPLATPMPVAPGLFNKMARGGSNLTSYGMSNFMAPFTVGTALQAVPKKEKK